MSIRPKPASGSVPWIMWPRAKVLTESGIWSRPWKTEPAAMGSRSRSRRRHLTSIPYQPSNNPLIREIARPSDGSRASFAGMRWPWSFGPIRKTKGRVAISAPSLAVRPSTKSPSTISSEDVAKAATRAIWFTSKATPRRACTRERSSKADCRSTSWRIFAANSNPKEDCAATPTLGSCPTSGNIRPSRWDSVRSWRSTKLDSMST